ncbi:MAG: hypothetical protein DRN57_00260 [Thermoplasmata archaeon]|nr:MAG: hypothetical protein DRN57_00260 [Thermoplasmata archaeon]
MRTLWMNVPVILLLLLSSGMLAAGTDDHRTSSGPVPSTWTRSGTNITGLYGGIITYEDTALIVNDNSEISREIGTYFAMRRGLPVENIINITAPTTEIIDFDQFDDMMAQIKENLSERGLTDRINYLVTTKGVPLKITSGYTNMNDQRYYSSASVDSELMLMDSEYEGAIHGRWWIPNPYFKEDTDSLDPFSREEYGIRLVTRLTGYTLEEAKRLVDLAEPSLGVRGVAYLDMDPSKGISSGGYGVGNLWMTNADSWLRENGWPSHLDSNSTFMTDLENVSAYFSWGSNDARWAVEHVTNGGFETGTGTIPSSWTVSVDNGSVERTSSQARSGSWSLMMNGSSSGIQSAYQDIDLTFEDHRYYIEGTALLQGVSGRARMYVKGYDRSGNRILFHELFNMTGTRSWRTAQDPIENVSGLSRLRFAVDLTGEGIVYFDNMRVRVIRPHNKWLPGSIAETIVSTGGRSQNYGTWYGQSLIADLIRDGVTGVKGYAWEPFISAISHADILFPAYYSGYSLAESYWMGSELGSWMGYVVGDPKCTPYLDERPDMGFSDTPQPVRALVDENGIPHLSMSLHNKGRGDVVDGLVELFVDNTSVWKERVSISAGGDLVINISSVDEPLIGHHMFRVVLNGDRSIWEYDFKNNQWEGELTVNSIPTLDISLEDFNAVRTVPFDFWATVSDDDGDVEYENLDVMITGPLAKVYEPQLVNTTVDGVSKSFMLRFVPPWNASIGYYSVEGRYVDPMGSFSEQLLYSRFKVLNHEPSINGTLGLPDEGNGIPRGGTFLLNVSWSDPDSQEGSIIPTAHAERALGGRIDPVNFTMTGSGQGSFLFELPVNEASGEWGLVTTITDRDGGTASWSAEIMTFNIPPSIVLVDSGPRNITRLQETHFTIRYLDPEGSSAKDARIAVFGPAEGDGTTIFEKEMTLQSGREETFTISGASLALGTYSLTTTVEDDERADATLRVDELFHVSGTPPIIGEPVISYEEGDGPPGGSFTRGASISVMIPVSDPDESVMPPAVAAVLSDPGDNEREIYLKNQGSGAYAARISTDGTWEVGIYSLRVTAVDQDGFSALLEVGNLFSLDADYPIFDEGSVTVHPNLTTEAEIYIAVFPASSRPVSVTLILLDGNDSVVGEMELHEGAGFGLWEGNGIASGLPLRGALHVIDDLGREIWMNETLDFQYPSPGGDVGPSSLSPDDTGPDLLVFFLVLGILLLSGLVAVISIIAYRSSRERRMMAAPPPSALPLLHESSRQTLPGSSGASLPPAGSGAGTEAKGAPAPLPPGQQLEEGGSYHRPIEGAGEPVPPAREIEVAGDDESVSAPLEDGGTASEAGSQASPVPAGNSLQEDAITAPGGDGRTLEKV